MDLKASTADVSGGVWTEERHASFLSGMEESFVRSLLAGDFQRCSYGGRRRRVPRLDRHLPDSATESNRRSGRATGPAAADTGIGYLADGRTRGRSPRRYDSPDDQVVPQLGGKETLGG